MTSFCLYNCLCFSLISDIYFADRDLWIDRIFFFFQLSKDVSHCLLASVVSEKKSPICIVALLYIIDRLDLIAFKIFLSLWYSTI